VLLLRVRSAVLVTGDIFLYWMSLLVTRTSRINLTRKGNCHGDLSGMISIFRRDVDGEWFDFVGG